MKKMVMDALGRIKVKLQALTPVLQKEVDILLRNCKEKKRVKVIVGDDSYNGEGIIQVGVRKRDALSLPWHIIEYVYIKYLLWHEVGHSLYTTRNFAVIIRQMAKWVDEKGRQENLFFDQIKLIKICHFIVNAIEDGRIEKIMVKKSPAFLEYRTWYWYRDWQNAGVDKFEGQKSVFIILNQILTIANIDKCQKGFLQKYKGTDVYRDVAKLLSPTRKAAAEPLCEGINPYCMEIIQIIYPYIKKDIFTLTLEELEKALERQSTQRNYADENTVVINLPEDLRDKVNQKKNSNEENTDENNTGSSEEKGTGNSEGDSKEEGTRDSEDDSKEKGTGDSEDDSEEKGTGNSEDDSKEEGTRDSDDDSKEKGTGDSEDDSEERGTRNSEDDLNEKETGDSDEDYLENHTGEFDGFEDSENIESMINSLEENAKKDSRNRRMRRSGMEEDWINALENAYEDEREIMNLVLQEADRTVTSSISSEKLMDGNRCKRFVEKVFKQRSVYDRTNLYAGQINTRQVYKLITGQTDFYCQKGQPYKPDARVLILVDNSGSMDGEKYDEAYKAASVLEEGFKSMIPLKIQCFCTELNDQDELEVIHTNIKDWDENSSKINYAETFRINNGVGGGNKDGYSIRIATTELAKFPETKKLLIVLSDGTPNGYYNGLEYAYRDTHNAIQEARESGLNLVGIFFGDENYIKESAGIYQALYEKDYIGVTPDKIQDELEKLLSKLI